MSRTTITPTAASCDAVTGVGPSTATSARPGRSEAMAPGRSDKSRIVAIAIVFMRPLQYTGPTCRGV